MTAPTVTLLEAFTTGPYETPDWELVEGVRSFDASAGKSSDLDRDQAGRCTVVVDARDREMDPANAAGSHYGDIAPNRRIKVTAGYVAEVMRHVPAAYWRLGELGTATRAWDEMGAHHGTAVNTPTKLVPGVLDDDPAYSFARASSEYVDTGDLSAFQSGRCTYAAWIKTSTTSGNSQAIFAESRLSTALGWSAILVANTTGVAQFQCQNDAGTVYTINSTTVVADGEWHHIVATRSLTTIKLYVDGVQEGGNVTIAGTFTQDTSNIAALSWSGTPTDFFNGTIDEVSVERGSARSATDVADMYAAGVTGFGTYIFDGFTDAHNVSYRNPSDAVVTIPATNLFKLLSRANLTGWGGSVIESAGVRVANILAHLGADVLPNLVFTGISMLRPIEVDPDSGKTEYEDKTGLEALMQIDATEAGRMVVDRNGRFLFLTRAALDENEPWMTPKATFGDEPGEIPYSDIVFENSETLLRNSVQVTHPEFDAKLADDSTSIDAYGLMSYSRESQDATEAAQNANAEWILGLYKDPQTRILSVTVDCARVDESFPNGLYGPVSAIHVGDRVTVKRTPPGGGARIEQDCFVLSRSDSAAAAEPGWRTTFGFGFAPDTSDFGEWDDAEWDTTGEWAY